MFCKNPKTESRPQTSFKKFCSLFFPSKFLKHQDWVINQCFSWFVGFRNCHLTLWAMARQVRGWWRNGEGAGALWHHHRETFQRRQPESDWAGGGGCPGEYVLSCTFLCLSLQNWMSLCDDSSSKLLPFSLWFLEIGSVQSARACLWSSSTPLRSSHVQSVSGDRGRERGRHRCKRLPHNLRRPGGHRGEKTEQVRDKQKQVWAWLCKKTFDEFLFFCFTNFYIKMDYFHVFYKTNSLKYKETVVRLFIRDFFFFF